jgi:CofD-related protein of GAK system
MSGSGDPITLSRQVTLPDPIRVERALSAPDLGPKILFFSGGTALRKLSRKLVRYTHNSVHIITPFDSGGSSAVLRKAFGMPAVGDLRNRLMALADRSVKGNPELFRLSAHRFDKSAPQTELRGQLAEMVTGQHRLVARVPQPIREIVCRYLRFFDEQMPGDFDLRGASIGNLILAGGYFNHGKRLDPVLYLFSRLIKARGTVRPVIDEDLHLAAELEDGSVLCGQHRITGKETDTIQSPVRDIWITENLDDPSPTRPQISQRMQQLIGGADLICYPMGSFYTSVLANLLPTGVGRAVAGTDCPKVYIPSLGHDPETLGLSLYDATRKLIRALRENTDEGTHPSRLLNFVLIDSSSGHYPEPLDLDSFQRLGVQVIDIPLVTHASAPLLDEKRIIELLVSLI